MRRARLAPQLEQARAHQRIFHAVAGIEIPAVARAARAAARLVVGQVGPRARIVGLLGLPGDDAALDVDLPRARAGAVHAVGRAHDLVVLPALAVAVLPARGLSRGELRRGRRRRSPRLCVEEGQAVEEMAHRSCLLIRPACGGGSDCAAAALDVVQQAAAAGVETQVIAMQLT